MSSKFLLNLIILSICILVYIFDTFYLNPYKGDFIAFLDVYTGDSILVVSGNDYALIDGGPNTSYSNTYKTYVVNKSLKAIFISHMHSDHISGLLRIITPLSKYRNYDVYINNLDHTTYESKKIKSLVMDSRKSFTRGESYKLNNFTIESLWPDKNCSNSDNLNYCSMGLLVTHVSGAKTLLLSDVEFEPQSKINYQQVGDVEIVKVPHQGSGDSLNTDFLKYTKPDYAVFSVNTNSWGHPHKSVIDYYTKIGSKVLQTKNEGDIVFYFK